MIKLLLGIQRVITNNINNHRRISCIVKNVDFKTHIKEKTIYNNIIRYQNAYSFLTTRVHNIMLSYIKTNGVNKCVFKNVLFSTIYFFLPV